jgi:alpha-beta hydrolase superfamily lysophospholipase
MGFTAFPSEDVLEDGTSVFSGSGHVEQLRELITSLHDHAAGPAQKYFLCAHSMGGAIATLYAAAYADEIAGVVMLSPAGQMDLGPLNLLRSACCCGLARCIRRFKYNDRLNEAAFRAFGDLNDYESPVARELWAAQQAQHLNNSRAFDALWECILHFPLGGLEPQVARLAAHPTLRVLVLHAEDDTAVPLQPTLQKWQGASISGRFSLMPRAYYIL